MKKLKDIENNIKSNYSNLQEKQKIRNNKNIKVVVTNKWILNLVETILTTIKLLLAFFTFLTLISLVSIHGDVLKIFKIITLVLTITFAVGNLLTTLIDKVLIRLKLKNIWGKNREIKGEYIVQKGFSSKLNVKTKAIMETKFSIYFNNKINFFDNKLRISVDELINNKRKKEHLKNQKEETEELNIKDIKLKDKDQTKWNITKSSLDVKNNILFIEFRRGNEAINIEIDLKNKIANWYGKIPNNIDYGYWKWI